MCALDMLLIKATYLLAYLLTYCKTPKTRAREVLLVEPPGSLGMWITQRVEGQNP